MAMTVLGTMLSLLALGSAATANAAEEAGPAPRPSAAIPVLGAAVAASGVMMTYAAAVKERDGDPSCATLSGDCTWVDLGGSVLAQIGGAAIAYWGWRLGEADARDDRAAGRVRSVDGYKIGGLVVGGLALAALDGAGLYAALGVFDCAKGRMTDEACLSRAKYTPTLVELGATGVLLVVAPLAGYGLGYAKTAGEGRPAMVVVPMASATGGGLALAGRF
jgi:hypothetical protein